MMTAKARIGFKEFEALFWCLGTISNQPERATVDPTDPLFVLLAEGFSRDEIMDTALGLVDRLGEDYLTEPLSEIDKAMLRVCIENTSWVSAYIQHGPLDGFSEASCRKVLRKLAHELEPLGVHVNFIAAR